MRRNHFVARGLDSGRLVIYGRLRSSHTAAYRSGEARSLTQTWFADDAGGGAKLTSLRSWWSALAGEGPKFGYFVNPPKTWLLVRDAHRAEAERLFQDTGIKVTSEGRPLLGAPLGTVAFSDSFIDRQVAKWVAELKVLSTIANTQPHAAFTALTYGFAGKWNYLGRVHMGLEAQFGRSEESIRTSFLGAVTGRAVSDVDRDLLSLPAKLGGIGVPNPVSCASAARQSALSVTQPLVDHLLDPHPSISIDRVFAAQASASSIARRDKIEALNKQADNIKVKLSPRAQAAMTLAQERGASSWLTALPLSGHGFSLSKADFRDALCLRYG